MTSMFPNSNCPTVYGPVKSRRHGQSLGINLGLADTKVCTWGCVYCQCGMGERRELQLNERVLDAKSILDLTRHAVSNAGALDSVTIAGNSEPTKHPEFLTIVKGLLNLRKELKAQWILNCLSNGSELNQVNIRQGCDLLDETWIKLDCAIDEMFRRLNRPLARIGSITQHLKKIGSLQHVFIQTLVWTCPSTPEISNWTESNKIALLEAYLKLKPRKIHMTTIARNPALSQIRPVSKQELEDYAAILKREGLNIDVFPS